MHVHILKIIMRVKEGKITNYIGTSHMLARELTSKPDGFIMARIGEEEYVIESIQRVATHANVDDGVMHLVLNLRDGGKGNIKR